MSNFGCDEFSTQYTIKYNANGGSRLPSSQTKIYDKSLVLSSTKSKRTNYTFKGWATSSTVTSAAYQPSGNYAANSSATLYAVWKHMCAAGHSYSYKVAAKPTTSAMGYIDWYLLQMLQKHHDDSAKSDHHGLQLQ